MNKIKILYDVFKTMKAKEVFNGNLTAEVTKEGNKVFSCENSFEKDKKKGISKSVTSTEFDCIGKKMKLQNNFEFQGDCCGGDHCFMNHIHSKLHACKGNGGVKDCLGKITFLFGVLHSMKVSEQEDKSTILSIETGDMPDELKAAFCEHMKKCCDNHKCVDEGDKHYKIMKELHNVEKKDFNLKVLINGKSEIESISLTVCGVHTDEDGIESDVKFTAELSMNW